MCNGSIPTGKTRYKSRTVADSDLCAACYQKSGGSPEQYFEIENVMAEMAFHQYFACTALTHLPTTHRKESLIARVRLCTDRSHRRRL